MKILVTFSASIPAQNLQTTLLLRQSVNTSVKAQARTAEPTQASVQRYTEQRSPDLVAEMAENFFDLILTLFAALQPCRSSS